MNRTTRLHNSKRFYLSLIAVNIALWTWYWGIFLTVSYIPGADCDVRVTAPLPVTQTGQKHDRQLWPHTDVAHRLPNTPCANTRGSERRRTQVNWLLFKQWGVLWESALSEQEVSGRGNPTRMPRRFSAPPVCLFLPPSVCLSVRLSPPSRDGSSRRDYWTA